MCDIYLCPHRTALIHVHAARFNTTLTLLAPRFFLGRVDLRSGPASGHYNMSGWPSSVARGTAECSHEIHFPGGEHRPCKRLDKTFQHNEHIRAPREIGLPGGEHRPCKRGCATFRHM